MGDLGRVSHTGVNATLAVIYLVVWVVPVYWSCPIGCCGLLSAGLVEEASDSRWSTEFLRGLRCEACVR